eukprot:scaffold226467_cov31-Tisochrysis_lutea.AAC.2
MEDDLPSNTEGHTSTVATLEGSARPSGRQSSVQCRVRRPIGLATIRQPDARAWVPINWSRTSSSNRRRGDGWSTIWHGEERETEERDIVCSRASQSAHSRTRTLTARACGEYWSTPLTTCNGAPPSSAAVIKLPCGVTGWSKPLSHRTAKVSGSSLAGAAPTIRSDGNTVRPSRMLTSLAEEGHVSMLLFTVGSSPMGAAPSTMASMRSTWPYQRRRAMPIASVRSSEEGGRVHSAVQAPDRYATTATPARGAPEGATARMGNSKARRVGCKGTSTSSRWLLALAARASKSR